MSASAHHWSSFQCYIHAPVSPRLFRRIWRLEKSRPVMKDLWAWGTKQLSEWKEFLNYVGKLISKEEPTWELNQILTLGSKFIFFDRHLKWEAVKDRVLSIPQRHGYLLLGAIAESSLHSCLSFFDGLFFILLNSLGSYSPKRDDDNLLPMKKIIIGSSRFGGISAGLKSNSTLSPAQSLANAKVRPSCSGLLAGLENLLGGSLHNLSSQCLLLLDCSHRGNYIQAELLNPCLPALLAHAACCPPESPGPFPQSHLPASQSPTCAVAKGFLFPRCRTSHLSMMNFIRFLSAHFSSLSRLNGTTTLQHIDYFSFVVICKPDEMTLHHLLQTTGIVLGSVHLHCITCPIQQQAHISLVQHLATNVVIEGLVLDATRTANVNTTWALAFRTTLPHAQTVFLNSSFAACSYFYSFFFVLEFHC